MADDRALETEQETTPILPAVPLRHLAEHALDEDHVSTPSSDPARESLDQAPDRPVPKAMRSESAAHILRDPPLLIRQPIADQPSAQAAVLQAVPRPAGQGISQPEQADVHIHIGCIEVTAVHEPAASRSRPSPLQPPMSLDAYLAKRGRG